MLSSALRAGHRCGRALARNYVSATVGKISGATFSGNAPMFFVDDQARPISPWHDVPLYVSDDKSHRLVNMVCEIPRGTRAKYEIATHREYNPITQDTTLEGLPRSYALDSIVNYGALPRTYEDPAHVDALVEARSGGAEKLLGDGDPLDVCEIGVESRNIMPGSMYQVKVLGALALIDGGEIDWKILAVKTTDPLADAIKDLKTAPVSVRRLMADIVTWFRSYKVPEGKSLNDFALGGHWQEADVAMEVIDACHKQYNGMVAERSKRLKTGRMFGEEDAKAAFEHGPWVWKVNSRRTPDFNTLEHTLATMPVREVRRSYD